MVEKQTKEKAKEPWLERLVSDGVLGTLVVLMTIATAVAAYHAALAEIRGGDLTFEAQRSLVLGATSFLQGSIEYLADTSVYDQYEEMLQEDPDKASLLLERGSQELQAGVRRTGGPFDDAYEEARYGDALSLIAETQVLNEQANEENDRSRRFQRASLALAIGLATAAWASLVEARAIIRLVFTLISLPFFLAGLSIILRVLAGS